jgi:hypothetical protein
MKWFRFYNEARRDPKIVQLSDWQFRVWVEILCVASEYDGKKEKRLSDEETRRDAEYDLTNIEPISRWKG